MNLIYLSLANLKDRLFIRDFVNNFKFQTPTLILHEAFGDTIQDSVFVTKRISSLLSESMVHNHAFPASQRDFYYFENGELIASASKIRKLLSPIPLLILGPIVKKEGVQTLVSAKEMAQAARKQFEIEYITLFSDNPLSPLGNAGNTIRENADIQPLLSLYEEEKASLEMALSLSPSRICTPRNYSL